MAASLHVPLGCLQGTGHAQPQGTMRRTLNALGLVARAHKLVDTNSAVTSSRGCSSIAGDEDLVDGMQHHWTTEGHVTLNNCVIKGPEDVGEHGARLYHSRGKQSDKAAGCAETLHSSAEGKASHPTRLLAGGSQPSSAITNQFSMPSDKQSRSK